MAPSGRTRRRTLAPAGETAQVLGVARAEKRGVFRRETGLDGVDDDMVGGGPLRGTQRLQLGRLPVVADPDEKLLSRGVGDLVDRDERPNLIARRPSVSASGGDVPSMGRARGGIKARARVLREI